LDLQIGNRVQNSKSKSSHSWLPIPIGDKTDKHSNIGVCLISSTIKSLSFNITLGKKGKKIKENQFVSLEKLENLFIHNIIPPPTIFDIYARGNARCVCDLSHREPISSPQDEIGLSD
jgi:hypothetical protein